MPSSTKSILPSGLSYIEYQRRVGREVVIPWLAKRIELEGASVGDFGAHHGGMLDAMRDTGKIRSAVGFELSADIVSASPFVADENFRLEVADVMTLDPGQYAFDLVILHDVMEHIPNSTRALAAAHRSLRPDGWVFVSFPPYYSAFGGHQQLARGHARLIPFVHLLPAQFFFRVARPGQQEYMSEEASLADMDSVRQAKLTLTKAERAFSNAGFKVLDRELYLVRPEYTVRYGLKARPTGRLGGVPGLREVVVNGAFYLLQPTHDGVR